MGWKPQEFFDSTPALISKCWVVYLEREEKQLAPILNLIRHVGLTIVGVNTPKGKSVPRPKRYYPLPHDNNIKKQPAMSKEELMELTADWDKPQKKKPKLVTPKMLAKMNGNKNR